MQSTTESPLDTQERDAPAFDFYCERWTHGTRHLTKVERCDYLDLLLYQWTSDGLPADVDMLARLVGYRKGSQISPLVLEKFPVAADGKRRNARLEEERTKQRDRIRRKRQGAAKTNVKRWGNAGGDAHAPATTRARSTRPTRQSLPAESLSESISSRLATDERVDIESPPPTTHHPPQNELAGERELPPPGADWPKSEEEARAVAALVGADADYVATVWREHDATGDYTRLDATGGRLAIRNFASYVKSRWGYRSHRQHETQALEKTKAELRRQGSQQSQQQQQQPSSGSSRAQGRDGGGSAAAREARAEQRGEIPTDVSVDKVKVYRLENA